MHGGRGPRLPAPDLRCCAVRLRSRAAGRREAEPGGHPGGAVSDAGLGLCRWLARCLALRSGGASAAPYLGALSCQGWGRRPWRRRSRRGPAAPPKEEVALTVASHRRRPGALPCALAAGPARPPRDCRPDPKDQGPVAAPLQTKPCKPGAGCNQKKESQAHLVPWFLQALLSDFCLRTLKALSTSLTSAT